MKARRITYSIAILGMIALTFTVENFASDTSDRELNQATEENTSRDETQPVAVPSSESSNTNTAAKPAHPLVAPLKIADRCLQQMRTDIRDYTCLLVKQERVNGRLRDREFIFAKVRHERSVDGEVVEPFSLYLKFLKPERVTGREVLYVADENENKILVRKGGPRFASLTTRVDPNSIFAMSGNRYPVTEFGVLRLMERLQAIGNHECQFGECNVSIDMDAQHDEIDCTRIDIEHPVHREHFEYHVARVYIDKNRHVPIRFESYYWPEENSDEPILQEEYTYRHLKTNVGLTDEDFDPTNPNYGFSVDPVAK